MTALHQLHQNLKLNHLHPLFDDKARIIALEDQGYLSREQGILTAMIQAGVVTELRVVKMVQGSMAVDLEADRSKVSRCLTAGHQLKEQLQHSVYFYI